VEGLALYLYDSMVKCRVLWGVNGSYLRLYGKGFVDSYLVGAATEVELVDTETKMVRRISLEDADVIDIRNNYIEFYIDNFTLPGRENTISDNLKCWATVRAF
jgi:hypothetical protein